MCVLTLNHLKQTNQLSSEFEEAAGFGGIKKYLVSLTSIECFLTGIAPSVHLCNS